MEREEQLKQEITERNLYHLLAKSSSEFIGMCDRDGVPFFINDAGLQLVGLDSIQQGIKTPVKEFFFPEDQSFIMNEFFPEVLQKGTGAVEIRFRHFKTGEELWMIYNVFALKDLNNNELGFGTVSTNITERKLSEAVLHKAQRDLNHAQAVAHIGNWRMDVCNNILEWSDENYRIFGIPKGTSLTYQSFLDVVHPEDRNFVDGAWKDALTGKPYDLEHRIIVGHNVKWVREKAELEFDKQGILLGAFGTTDDITSRKQLEDRLRWSEESFQLMVESVTDYSIVMLNPEGRVMSWNSGAEQIKGYSEEEIIGQHFSRFYPPEDIDCGKPQRVLDIVNAKGWFKDEGWRVRKDGSTFWAHVVFTAIRSQGSKLRGFAKVTRDMTERKRLDQVLQDKNVELEKARSMAEKANLAKSDFLSSMSHELRTPLNTILGFAQLMEAGSPPPTDVQSKRLGQIIKSGWYLLELINEILNLSSIESGKLLLSRESVLLIDVILECKAMIEPQAEQRGIKLIFPSNHNKLLAYVDRIRLKQVLLNLLSNALKYNQPHGTVEVKCTATSLGLIRISIKDSGIGLPPEQLAQLFQPFNRLGQEVGVEEGTGLGLVVSKQLVELMGGTIGVESTVGEGSEFWIELLQSD
jgi:PAS domain S-box-containing protein